MTPRSKLDHFTTKAPGTLRQDEGRRKSVTVHRKLEKEQAIRKINNPDLRSQLPKSIHIALNVGERRGLTQKLTHQAVLKFSFAHPESRRIWGKDRRRRSPRFIPGEEIRRHLVEGQNSILGGSP